MTLILTFYEHEGEVESGFAENVQSAEQDSGMGSGDDGLFDSDRRAPRDA